MASNRKTPKVLVVEDDRYLREALDRILRTHSWCVSTAADGMEALDLIDSVEEGFDSMVIDIVLPELSGVDLAERVAVKSPRTKIVFMSGITGDIGEVRGLDPGSTRFLAKPFTATKLLEALAT